MSGSICPSAVAIQPSNVCFHFLKNKTHSLSPFFAIHFEGTMSKNAGVSSMLLTSEKGYFPILINIPASVQNLIRIEVFDLIEVRDCRASLCRVKNLSTQPRLAGNDGLSGCIRSFSFSRKLKTNTGKCKSCKAKIHVISLSSCSTGQFSRHPAPGKLHLLECFTLSSTGEALINPRTVDSFIPKAFAVSARFRLIQQRQRTSSFFIWLKRLRVLLGGLRIADVDGVQENATVDHTSCRNQPSHKSHGVIPLHFELVQWCIVWLVYQHVSWQEEKMLTSLRNINV